MPWCLPATKTDPAAISVSREWGRLCTSGSRSRCPAHVAMGRIAILEEYFGPRDQWPLDLPLFPDQTGGVVEKEAVVLTLEALAAKVNMPLRDQMGRRAIRGHSVRVTGAKHLASVGIELYKLSLLARWSSPVIMRYVGEAPMAEMTNDCKRSLPPSPMRSISNSCGRMSRSGTTRLWQRIP